MYFGQNTTLPRQGQPPLAKVIACTRKSADYSSPMFSIEHEFDATVITLVDEGEAPLQEDVTVNVFAECITIEQLDPRTDTVHKITLSHAQARDLAAALNLPEGVYSLAPKG